jgi:hypothetical protein
LLLVQKINSLHSRNGSALSASLGNKVQAPKVAHLMAVFLILCAAARNLRFCTNDPLTSESKITYKNCENVVGFGSHKPKRKTLHADRFRDPGVQRWPIHRIINELQEEVQETCIYYRIGLYVRD